MRSQWGGQGEEIPETSPPFIPHIAGNSRFQQGLGASPVSGAAVLSWKMAAFQMNMAAFL